MLAFQLPQASTFAKNVDGLFNFITLISAVSLIATVLAMVYFVWRYHEKKTQANKTAYIEGNTALEVGVSVSLFVLVMIIFAWGWKDYKAMRTFPKNAIEVNVIGKQWSWGIEYNNGRKMVNELVVPVNTPVKLVMSASDVLHSFYVPGFRVKQDLVPGRYTRLWFEANKLGEYPAYCA